MLEIDEKTYLHYWRLWHHNRDASDSELVRVLCDPDRTRVLEIGCGDGRVAWSLAPYCNSFVGVDIDAVLIAAARQTAMESACRNVHFECMSAERLLLDDEHFDRVLFAWSLHMLGEPGRALQEAFRVLKKDGLLVIVGLRSDGQYDRIINSFADARSIDVQKTYEIPLSEVFGTSAIRLQEERTFSYHFANAEVAYDAFLFALKYWYGKVLLDHELETLKELVRELEVGGTITIDFPANVYIVGKSH